jgi:hypothetical protein
MWQQGMCGNMFSMGANNRDFNPQGQAQKPSMQVWRTAKVTCLMFLQ